MAWHQAGGPFEAQVRHGAHGGYIGGTWSWKLEVEVRDLCYSFFPGKYLAFFQLIVLDLMLEGATSKMDMSGIQKDV